MGFTLVSELPDLVFLFFGYFGFSSHSRLSLSSCRIIGRYLRGSSLIPRASRFCRIIVHTFEYESSLFISFTDEFILKERQYVLPCKYCLGLVFHSNRHPAPNKIVDIAYPFLRCDRTCNYTFFGKKPECMRMFLALSIMLHRLGYSAFVWTELLPINVREGWT